MTVEISWKNLSGTVSVAGMNKPAKAEGDIWAVLNAVPLDYWLRQSNRIRSTEWPEVEIALCLQKLPGYEVKFKGAIPGYKAPPGAIV